MKNEAPRRDSPVTVPDSEEQAVQDAVRAIESDVQTLLQQHFEDVRHVLPQLLRGTLDQVEREVRQAATRIPTPERTPHDDHGSRRWWTRWAPRPAYAGYAVTVVVVVLVVGLAWWQFSPEEPTRASGVTQPDRGVVRPTSEPEPSRQDSRSAELLTNIRAKRDVWDQHYRTGRMIREIRMLLVGRGREDRPDSQALAVAKTVLEAAGRYEQDATLTTLQDEDRLATALVQSFVRQQSSDAKFQVDGVLAWREFDNPQGQSAPHVQRYLNQRYLARYGTSVEGLARDPRAPAFPQLLAGLERALLVDQVLQVGR